MFKTNKSDLFGGSLLSKILGLSSLIFLIFTFITLMSRMETYDITSKEVVSSEIPWKIAILWFVLSGITGYIAYRLAGGRKNPTIWKDKDLYELLKYAALSGQARIGFHSLRDQSLLLVKLESIGIKKELSEDTRQFIRDKVVMDRRVFDICRDNMIIQMIHKGKEWFWDGYGKRKTVQYFHEAEIIFDLKSSIDYIFFEVLEGLKEVEGLEKKIE